MTTAKEVAKFFIKHGFDSKPNTYDGNMKIQKLLFFANLISLAEYKQALFPDPIYAFPNGCVVEGVRLEYRDGYNVLLEENKCFDHGFSENDKRCIDLTLDIYGDATAKELSEINHGFQFWKNAMARSTKKRTKRDMGLALIKEEEFLEEIGEIISILEAVKLRTPSKQQIVNGIKFFFDLDFQITEKVLEALKDFSIDAEDSAYSVYYDRENLVMM